MIYNYFEDYVSFVYSIENSQENVSKPIYQITFSCLPLLNGHNSINVEIDENIFAKYFKKAVFQPKKSNFTDNLLPLYKVLFETDYEPVNYLLLKYNAINDLQESGCNCFSNDGESN